LKNLLLKKRFLIVILALITLANLFLTSMPLLNILSYESSAINAILFSLLSGIYWLAEGDENSKKIRVSFFLYIISIPFLILIFSTLICQNCPLSDGIYFYLVIAVPSIFTGIAIAQFSKFMSIKFRYSIFIFLWLILLLGFLPELYYNPQIYFYNPIFGYYPGVIYDQTIEITNSLLIYRLVVFIFSFASILIFSKNNNYTAFYKIIMFLGIFLTYIILSYLKPNFNFSTNLESIKKEISSEVKTDHFKIIFPSSLTNKQIEMLKYDHEFYYKIISELLNTELESKITSIIFESGTQKKELFGSANADVAKPWLNQIYLDYSNYDASLKHEISHIFSAKFAEGLFNLPSNFNPGMIEGFAMAIENNYDNFDIDYLAALAFMNNFKISLSNLFTDFSFFANSSSLSYIYAGSFIKYLADNYGWNKVKKIYAGEGFIEVYNKNITVLEENYYKYLPTITVEENKNKSNYYFGRKPLIKKFCARATAKELKTAQILYKEKEYEDAAKMFSKIYKYSGSYAGLVGFAQTQKELDMLYSGINFLEEEIQKFEGTAYFYYLEFLLADFHALNNDSSEASEYYSKIIEQNPHNSYLRSAELKNNLLQDGDSILIKFMTDNNFKTNQLLEFARKGPTNSSLQLLSSLQNIDSSQYSEIINNLVPFDKISLLSETYFAVSQLSYRFSDLNTAVIMAEKAFNKSEFKTKDIIKEHLAKMKWIIDTNKNN
jgi:hypothetical protein